MTLTGHLPDGFELIRSQGAIPRKDYLSLAVVAIPMEWEAEHQSAAG